MKKIVKITWNQYLKDVNTLCTKLEKVKNQFDLVVGIERGGVIPAYLIAYRLGKPFKFANVLLPWSVPVYKKILLVDDISDTGKTLHLLTSNKVENKLTATVYIKKDTAYRPNYFIKAYPKEQWIVFPYEKLEKVVKIVTNKIKCRKCGNVIESKNKNDFKRCKCGAVAVYGGHDYLKRNGNATKYVELSKIVKEYKS
jgi:hypoxanthine phosphoribosyltransferase